jgi:hypothetical protein
MQVLSVDTWVLNTLTNDQAPNSISIFDWEGREVCLKKGESDNLLKRLPTLNSIYEGNKLVAKRNDEIVKEREVVVSNLEDITKQLPKDLFQIVSSYLLEDIIRKVNGDISHKDISQEWLQGIAHTVKTLDLSKLELTEAQFLALINKFINLEELNCLGCTLTDECLLRVSELKKLTTLKISGYLTISDSGLNHLVKLENLEHLVLDSCVEITYEGLKNFSTLRKFKHLEIIFGPVITNNAVKYISSCKKLEYLALPHCGTTDSDILKELSQLKRLTFLDLCCCKDIIDLQFTHILALKNLQTLKLNNCDKITATGIAELAKLLKLETVVLTRKNLDCNTDLEAIALCKNLRHLEIVFNGGMQIISEVGFEYLTRLRKLETLKIVAPSIVNNGLRRLTELPQLKELRLHIRSKVEEAEFAYLINQKNQLTIVV